ncbi:TetR/AcrR family transcriptional regulator [Hoyosella altamirensis]|uniref:AcrR family transcriptional regulator n=1 Tax=Hoyosella altamirensis TaxID=616997 RepID=A0A839RT26_9ACTN|nr:TetR/AcrR family transcriptional regulator [Hoyosella altamirensis]MBB3039224.1 AcrR family transcriptional regulator [Hoyosella altamirensis]
MTRIDPSTRTRHAILQAAASALRKHERAGMADIADEGGFGRATLYRYFASREELLVELSRFAAQTSLEALDEARIDSIPVPDALSRATRALLTVGRELWTVSTHRKELWPEEEKIGDLMRDLVARGQHEGILRGDLPAHQLSVLFGSLIIGALTLDPLRQLGVEDAADAIMTVFMDGARVR